MVFSYTQPSNGKVTGLGPVVTYTPDPNFSGDDTFTWYAVLDNGAKTNVALAKIKVKPPVIADKTAVDVSVTTEQNTPVNITLDLSSLLPLVELGVNLEENVEWNRTHYFVDCIKSARGFWDCTLGADGWPITASRILILTVEDNVELGITYGSLPPNVAGTYKLLFEGNVAVVAKGATIKNLFFDGVRTRADVVYDGKTSLWLEFGAPVKNVKFLRPGYDETKTFTDEFLLAIKPFKVLRLMNWMNTNVEEDQRIERNKIMGTNGVLDWADRPKKTDPIQWGVFGASIEYAVELANTANKDLWINIPDKASDDYIKGLAQYLLSSLNPTLKVYLEYSNEVWNGIFGQMANSIEAAKITPGLTPAENDYYLARRYTMKRIIDASNIFRSVFGNLDRVRPVFADQVGWGYGAMAASTLDWAFQTYPQPLNYYLYGLAIAPYYYANGNTVDELIASLRKTTDDKVTWNQSNNNPASFYTLAQTYGLKLLGYEGGLDTGQGTNNLTNRISVSYDARMRDVTKEYLAQFYAAGGSLMCYYNLAATYSKWGQWGLTDDVTRLNAPKYLGAKDISALDPRTFENGLTKIVSSGILGNGSGLTGTYTVGTTVVKRVDRLIDFFWSNYGTGMPIPIKGKSGITTSGFSVSWSGKVVAKETGVYTFTAEIRQGSSVPKFTINGQDMLANPKISLTSGQEYAILLEYKPDTAWNPQGSIRLWWEINGRKSIVPTSQLVAV